MRISLNTCSTHFHLTYMSKLIQDKQHNKPHYNDPHFLFYEWMKASDKIGASILSLTSQYSGICQCSCCYIFTKSLLLHFGKVLAGCWSLAWFLPIGLISEKQVECQTRKSSLERFSKPVYYCNFNNKTPNAKRLLLASNKKLCSHSWTCTFGVCGPRE